MNYFENFVNKANKKYNYKYDYSKFNYVNAKTPSIIICPVHGEFLQKPDHHLRKDAIGCPECVRENKIVVLKKVKRQKPPKGKDAFLEKALSKFGNKFEYDLSNYSGMTGNPIKIKCPVHGWFEKVPRVFIVSGYGCNKCGHEKQVKSKTKSYDDFIKEATIIHGNKYIYPESNRKIFKNRRSKIKIFCPRHNLTFEKSAQKHLSGQECFKCRISSLVDRGILLGGYNLDFFETHPYKKNEKAWAYYLSVDNGRYYKVGITTNLQKRIRALRSAAKREGGHTIKLLHHLETTLYEAYLIEQAIFYEFSQHRISLEFSTEILDKDISKTHFFKDMFNL